MLVFCCTPLQTLIAKSMIKARGVTNFKLIYFTWTDNDKHRHYYRALSELAEDAAYICLDSWFPTHFSRFRRAFRKLRAQDAQSIAFACIDNFYIQYAINQYGFGTIVTFDDGTTNIAQDSAYYKSTGRSFFHDRVGRLLRGHIDQSWIRQHASNHYTIYPEFENIVGQNRLISIRLLDAATKARAPAPQEKRLRIFLGQVAFELRDEGFSRRYVDIVNALQIDEYLPHPRESDLTPFVKIAKTHLIAEHYIDAKLGEYDEVWIYSFSTAALLNIEHPRVKKFMVTYPDAPSVLVAVSRIFEQRGCTLLNADDIDYFRLA